MALPADLGSVTLVASYVNLATGEPLSGTVTFIPQTAEVATSGDRALLPAPLVVTVTAGAMSTPLPVTNDADYSPANAYLVTEKLAGVANRAPYLIQIDTALAGTTVKLLSLTPAPVFTLQQPYLPITGGTLTGALTVTGTVQSNNLVTCMSSGQAGFFKSTINSGSGHALTAYLQATSGANNSALNVVSDNVDNSAMLLSGAEKNRGTLKIAHRGQADGSDASGSAISIDLQTAGTGAQGIFLTGTNGPTTGNLITLRNNSRDDFVVKGSGLVGIGLATGATPAGRLDIRQVDDSTVGLAITANSGAAQQMVLLKDSGGNARFEVSAAGNTVMRATAFFTTSIQVFGTSAVLGGGTGVISINNRGTAPTSNNTGGGILYAEAGALKWRGSSGTVTTIATA